MNMKQELVNALNASFSEGGWLTVGVNIDTHEHHVPGDPSADPPTAPTTETHVATTLQVQNAAREMLLVFVLKGDENGYTSATLMAGGSWVTDDATLISRLAASVSPALDALSDALVEQLTEEIED